MGLGGVWASRRFLGWAYVYLVPFRFVSFHISLLNWWGTLLQIVISYAVRVTRRQENIEHFLPLQFSLFR